MLLVESGVAPRRVSRPLRGTEVLAVLASLSQEGSGEEVKGIGSGFGNK